MSKLTDFYVHKAAIIEKGEPIIQSGGGEGIYGHS